MALIAAAVWILQPHGETSDVAMKTETRGDTVLFEPQPAASDPIAQAPVSATTPGRGQAEIRPGGPDVALKQAPVRAITKQDEAADIVLMESASENREMAYQSSGPEEDAAVAAPPPVSAVQEEAGKTYQDDRLAMPQGTPNQMPQAKPAVKETEAPQNQSVETAAASKTKRAESKKKAAPTPSKSEPAGGWKAWDLYVQNNRRYTEEARLAGIEGKVVINFLVDENNQPGYFVVKTPLGYGLDEEALRLVRGFAWVRGKDPQVRVEVVFKL
jgi:TonB family protein